MTNEAALLAAIAASPDDDTPRLIYADWLGEPEQAGSVACPGGCKQAGNGIYAVRATNRVAMVSRCPTCRGSGSVSNGNAARAAFIRVQVALALLPPRPSGNCRCDGGGTVCGTCRDERDWDEEAGPLRERERKLWDTGVGSAVTTELRRAVPITRQNWSWRVTTDAHDRPDEDWTFVVARGFPAEARLTVAAMMDRECVQCRWRPGSGINRDNWPAPINCPTCSGTGRTPGLAAQLGAVVGLCQIIPTDKSPSEWSAGANGDKREWVWERSMADQPNPGGFNYLEAGPYNPGGNPEASVLPPEVFDEMEGESGMYYFVIGKHGYREYATRKDAIGALSRRLLAMSKHAAGRIRWPTRASGP